MDWQRTLLLGGIGIVVVMLFQEWNKFEQQHKPVEDTRTVVDIPSDAPAPDVLNEQVVSSGDDVPSVSSSQPQVQPVNEVANSVLISVNTDVLEMLINPRGGDIVKVALPKYLKKLDEDDPYILLNQTSSHIYIAQSGLIGKNGTDKSGGVRPLFTSASSRYDIQGDELVVDLSHQQGDVSITKRFTFRRGDYLVDIDYLIDNRSAENWQANIYAQIKRDTSVPDSDAGFGMQPYVGAAITTPEENYTKLSFDDIREKRFDETYTGGWVAMLQHYFMSAWVPQQDEDNNYKLRRLSNGDYSLGYVGPGHQVAAGQSGTLKTRFYAGPKIIEDLEAIHQHLDLTVDHGWAWWISKPLFWLLDFLHNFVGNWGWAILLLTLCVRIPMYPLFAKSARSMAGMRKIQPEMQRLKELYGDDRQKMSQEMMGLYKKHGVNPMGGCLPMLLPMPIFLGLYYMLFESVELRHADWLWIADLSVKDPLFILPLIMGLTMWIQQKLNPQPAEASMATAMKIMPIMFTFMFMWFPAGLVLYWTVNNVFSIAQSWFVNKKLGV
ncbi:membrane protein insertase YidC [Porticoccus sp. GXU_MW_L64]